MTDALSAAKQPRTGYYPPTRHLLSRWPYLISRCALFRCARDTPRRSTLAPSLPGPAWWMRHSMQPLSLAFKPKATSAGWVGQSEPRCTSVRLPSEALEHTAWSGLSRAHAGPEQTPAVNFPPTNCLFLSLCDLFGHPNLLGRSSALRQSNCQIVIIPAIDPLFPHTRSTRLMS